MSNTDGPLFRDAMLGHEFRATLANHLEDLATRQDYEERRRQRRQQWRHANGLDTNGHGQLIPEEEDKL